MRSRGDGVGRRAVVGGGLVAGGAVWVAPAVLTIDRAVAEFSPLAATTLYLRGGSSPLADLSTTQGGSLEDKAILKEAASGNF